MTMLVEKDIGLPLPGLDDDVLPQTYCVAHPCSKKGRCVPKLYGMLRSQHKYEQQTQKVLWKLPQIQYYP